MKVTLPDGKELELPDGSTGLDAAQRDRPEARRAGRARALERHRSRTSGLPLADGQPDPVPDRLGTSHDPDALCVLRHSSAHLLAEAVRRLYPGVKIAIGPPIEQRLLLRLRVPRADRRRRPRADRGRGANAPRGGPRPGRARRSRATRPAAASPPRSEPYKVELVDTAEGDISLYSQSHDGTVGEFTDLCRGPHLQDSTPIKAFKLTGLAGAYWRGDEHNTQLTRIYGTAFFSAGRPRGAPRAARGGAQARPPPARHPARPVPLLRGLAGLPVLAPEGDGDLERARGPPPPREPRPRLRRGAHAADLRQVALGDLGALGEVPRAHVHVRVRESRRSASSR